MAGYSYLKKVQARELDRAVSTLDGLLGGDPEVSEALTIAMSDDVGKGDPAFRTSVLPGCLARVVLEQQRRIEKLEKQQAPRQSRQKAS